jgi:hypothetical protein
VQYVFSNWSGNVTALVPSGYAVISTSQGGTFTANYTTQYYLTTTASPATGGTITPASQWYNSGFNVTVTAAATPSTAWRFTNFNGDPNKATSPLSVIMSAPQAVTAYFALPATTTTLQTLPSPSTYSPNVSLTATVAPSAATGSVTFYDGATSLGTANLSNGTATLNVTTLVVGSHTLSATYAGSTNSYAGSTSTPFTITVSQATQTITFNPGSTPLTQQLVAIPATVSSGLPLSFSSSTPNICTISGTNMNLFALGTCTITASQAGNANYSAAASVQQNITITPELQSISFFPPGNPPGTITQDKSPITLTATATSGLPVTYSATGAACSVSGSVATLLVVGTCTITASQSGGGNYQAATPVSIQLTVVAPLQVYTQITYTNFTPASKIAGTATITATVTGGSIPSARAYSWAATGFQSSAQYSIPAPSVNTTVVLTVSDGASIATKSVTVKPSPSIGCTAG